MTLSIVEVVQNKLRLRSLLRLGLCMFLVERWFFPENKRNDQERSHRSKKKNAQYAFLKMLERLLKERNGMERELLEKNC